MRRGLVVALCVIGLAGSASAKGVLQMVGTIDNVRLQDDVLAFEFTGWITSGFASAPQNHPSYRWQNVKWQVKNLQIRIARWPTDDHNRMSIEDVAALATRLKETRHEAGGSIDEPKYSTSNTGQLLRIEGSKVYLVDRAQR
jgi:hypothetical protein